MTSPMSLQQGVFYHIYNRGNNRENIFINNTYNRTGSLFQHPFGRRAVISNQHFIYLIIYIHLNPQRHRLVDDFRSWPFSSYHAFLSRKSTRLQREEVYGIFGSREDLVCSHAQMTNFSPIAYLVNDDED